MITESILQAFCLISTLEELGFADIGFIRPSDNTLAVRLKAQNQDLTFPVVGIFSSDVFEVIDATAAHWDSLPNDDLDQIMMDLWPPHLAADLINELLDNSIVPPFFISKL